jgi:hypothetical protein
MFFKCHCTTIKIFFRKETIFGLDNIGKFKTAKLGERTSHHWIWWLFFFCKATFAKRPRQQPLDSILFKQVLAAMEFGGQPLAAKRPGYRTIFFKCHIVLKQDFDFVTFFKFVLGCGPLTTTTKPLGWAAIVRNLSPFDLQANSLVSVYINTCPLIRDLIHHQE